MLFKPLPQELASYKNGDASLLLESPPGKILYNGLTTKQIVEGLYLKKPQAHTIPVYTRTEGKLTFLSPEEFEDIFHVAFCPALRFASYEVMGAIAKRTMKAKQKQETTQMNKWTQAMFLRQYQKGSTPLGAIKWIGHDVGYGVFAYKDIPRYTYIGMYTGHVRRRSARKDQFNNYVFRYVCGIKNSPYVIDAKEMGDFTRFINHSHVPNLTSRWMMVDGITQVIFFTNQFIKRGTQLTYDYGEYYWRSRPLPKRL